MNHDKYFTGDGNVYKIGDYEIHISNPIGVGGYSIIYYGKCINEATIKKYKLTKSKIIGNTVHNNIVAVKKILVRDASDKIKKAILDEINIIRKIIDAPHPNIVSCYDVIDDIDTIYIIMEYCENGDLSKIIGKPIKEETVKYYFKQLIKGVKYMNDNQIIHRDIKPKNILLTDDNKVLKICDFGLAKNKSSLSRVNTFCGSPLYMAPEMFYNRNYNETVDIWSIGIILYEMLYGINPFSKVKDKYELEQIMINIKEEIKIPSKQTKNKTISKTCRTLLNSLLQKTSSTRITFEKLYIHEWFNEVNIINHNEHVSSNNDIDQVMSYTDLLMFVMDD